MMSKREYFKWLQKRRKTISNCLILKKAGATWSVTRKRAYWLTARPQVTAYKCLELTETCHLISSTLQTLFAMPNIDNHTMSILMRVISSRKKQSTLIRFTRSQRRSLWFRSVTLSWPITSRNSPMAALWYLSSPTKQSKNWYHQVTKLSEDSLMLEAGSCNLSLRMKLNAVLCLKLTSRVSHSHLLSKLTRTRVSRSQD